MSSDEHSRTISFECTLLKKDILRAVKETYPMYFDQPIEIENEGEMVLVYSSGEISVRKLADSLPVYVEVKSEYETSFFDEEDDT